jgi:predicted nucleic acid-binding protein
MILVDTSVWVDHLRVGNEALAELLDRAEVLAHPWVIGELALTGVKRESLALLMDLPQAELATEDEVRDLISEQRLSEAGIGKVDTQLLTVARHASACTLWTDDSRLAPLAEQLGVGFRPQ